MEVGTGFRTWDELGGWTETRWTWVTGRGVTRAKREVRGPKESDSVVEETKGRPEWFDTDRF